MTDSTDTTPETDEQGYDGPDQLVRVRIGDVEKNMGRALASISDGVEILEGEPTRTPDGRLLDESRADGRPVKPKTTVATAAAAKKTATSAGNVKE